MQKNLTTSTIVLAAVLILLHASGYLAPGSLNWGFHFFGFLPGYIFFLYLLLAAAAFLFAIRGPVAAVLEQAGDAMEHRPLRFLGITVASFFFAAFAFRVKASLLGDSFTLLWNFADYASGAAPLAPWHEPLSVYFWYYALSLFGALQYPAAMTAFFIWHLLLGTGFILCVFAIVKLLLEDRQERVLTFVMLLVFPSTEFFFGYIEVYAFSQVLLGIFLLASLLVLKDRLSFVVLPTLWLLLTLSHFVNGALGLTVLYLAAREYRRSPGRVGLGFAGAGVLLLIIVALAGFQPERLFNISPVSHFLAPTMDLTEENAYSQAYPLFSFYHGVDLFNTGVFLAPFGLLFLAVGLITARKEILREPISTWFLLAILPILAALCFTKLEQGYASDWDVYASQLLLVNLFGVLLFFREKSGARRRVFALAVLVTLLNAMGWFNLNALREPAIWRFQTLWDPRILSHLGNYTHALRLNRFFEAEQDTLRQIEVWKRYSELYPDDPRGYINQIQVISLYAPEDYQSKGAAYEQLLRREQGNDSLHVWYASFLLNTGNRLFTEGKLQNARSFYEKALRHDSTLSRAVNNLGSVLAEQGKIDSALILFRRAVHMDSSYADAYFNEGSALVEIGEKALGLRAIQKAAGLGNERAREFLRSYPAAGRR